jgi:toxin ParE1/3/4
MKRAYAVTWSETAEADFLFIIEHIADDGPSRACGVSRELRTKAASFRSFPERGRIVPELHEQGITLYHELIVGPWRLIYRISEKHVYVLSVLDSRRNLEDILLRRSINLKL